MTQKLSILLATVESRADMFAKLHAELARQCEGLPVELVSACDNKQISIGRKRQDLLERATGDYVVFIDDDDWVSEDYVASILAAVETRPDCVGFEITCTQNGRNPRRAIASMRYKQWGDNQDGYDYTRSTYHKTPVLREIALKVGFKDLRYCEDRPYSEGIIQIVKTEVFIPKVLYFYRFKSEPFCEKYGIQASRPSRVDYKGRSI